LDLPGLVSSVILSGSPACVKVVGESNVDLPALYDGLAEAGWVKRGRPIYPGITYQAFDEAVVSI